MSQRRKDLVIGNVVSALIWIRPLKRLYTLRSTGVVDLRLALVTADIGNIQLNQSLENSHIVAIDQTEQPNYVPRSWTNLPFTSMQAISNMTMEFSLKF